MWGTTLGVARIADLGHSILRSCALVLRRNERHLGQLGSIPLIANKRLKRAEVLDVIRKVRHRHRPTEDRAVAAARHHADGLAAGLCFF